MRLVLVAASALFSLSIIACSSDPADPDVGEFVVRGSASATPFGLAASRAASGYEIAGAVDANRFEVGLLEMRLSANANCSAPYQTVFTHTTPDLVDLVAEPEIARVTGIPDGTYPCVAIRLSDLIGFRPSATEGFCTAGTNYTHDFYRAGNEPTPFKDIALANITARGTEAAPVEDFVWAYYSTNPGLVIARGYSANQVGTLTAGLVSPGTTTFFWSGDGVVASGTSRCQVNAAAAGFR